MHSTPAAAPTSAYAAALVGLIMAGVLVALVVAAARYARRREIRAWVTRRPPHPSALAAAWSAGSAAGVGDPDAGPVCGHLGRPPVRGGAGYRCTLPVARHLADAAGGVGEQWHEAWIDGEFIDSWPLDTSTHTS